MNLINFFFQWIASLLQSDPSIVWMEAQEWLRILEKARNNNNNELLEAISIHYHALIGEVVASLDGGQSFVGIKVPLEFHRSIQQLRDT